MLYFFVSDNTNTNEEELRRNIRLQDQLTGTLLLQSEFNKQIDTNPCILFTFTSLVPPPVCRYNILTFPNPASNIVTMPLGDQIGAYYGYSMACGDSNQDGYDDLLVSAPWYSMVTSAKSSIISVGRVYVYNGDPTRVVSNANKPTIIGQFVITPDLLFFSFHTTNFGCFRTNLKVYLQIGVIWNLVLRFQDLLPK